MRLATIALALGLAIPAPASACGVELVLAMDVSRSVINDEYDLQMGGLANALRSKEVVEAIGWIPGGVMATVTQWSGELDQAQTVGWRHLTNPSSVLAFAKEIGATRTPSTVSNYLSHLGAVFALARPAWGMELDQQAMKDAFVVCSRLGITGKGRSRDLYECKFRVQSDGKVDVKIAMYVYGRATDLRGLRGGYGRFGIVTNGRFTADAIAFGRLKISV